MTDTRPKTAGRIYTVTAVLAAILVVGVWTYGIRTYIDYRGLVFPPSFSGIVLPAILSVGILIGFVIVALVSREQRMSWPAHVVFTGGELLGVGVLGLMVFLFELTVGFGWSATNPERYEYWLGWYHADMTGHFPPTIPDGATNAHFSYNPGPLQAASHLQLRVTLPERDVVAVIEKYKPQARLTCRGGEASGQVVPLTHFYTLDEDRQMGPSHAPFPDSFLILYLGPYSTDAVAVKRRKESGFFFNHGASYGLAIAQEANEVVYWAEGW